MTESRWPQLAFAWDHRTGQLEVGADYIASFDGEQRAGMLERMRRRARSEAEALDDGWLLATAVVMVEDLYKTYCRGLRYTPEVLDYLRATAATVTGVLADRGYVLQYLIDCSLPGPEHLRSLAWAVASWYSAAGLHPVGPQMEALLMLLQASGGAADPAGIRRFLDDGYRTTRQLVDLLQQRRDHYVYLNATIDGTPAFPVDFVIAQRDTPGTLLVIRDRTPLQDPSVLVAPPPGVELPAGFSGPAG